MLRNGRTRSPGGPAFRQLKDITLATSAARSGTLLGTDVSPATLTHRLDGAKRVWLVEMLGSKTLAPLAASGLYRVASHSASDVQVSLYER